MKIAVLKLLSLANSKIRVFSFQTDEIENKNSKKPCGLIWAKNCSKEEKTILSIYYLLQGYIQLPTNYRAKDYSPIWMNFKNKISNAS